MCVPVPVDKMGGNINPRGKLTGGLPAPQMQVVNQMMTPFRRAASGENLEEQRKRFADPKSMAALLTRRDPNTGGGRPY